jgi:hypothetical protein
MLTVVMLNVIMLSVVALNVIMLSAVMLDIIMRSLYAIPRPLPNLTSFY